jgi:hypothetical protein
LLALSGMLGAGLPKNSSEYSVTVTTPMKPDNY